MIYDELKKLGPLSYLEKSVLTRDGYFHVFEELITSFNTRRDAYEFLEEIHERLVGERRYSEYDVFRKVYRRYKKKCL